MVDVNFEDDAEGFAGDYDYSPKKEARPNAFYDYKVWNAEVGKSVTAETPGLILTTITGPKEARVKSSEIVEKVRAVILYQSKARELATGKGESYRVVCKSDDGYRPSISVDAPLCRKATTEDLVQIFSQWKGADKAKVDENVAQVSSDGCLQTCGLKTGRGVIPLCSYAKRDPITGTQGACREFVSLFAYDVERNRPFRMKLKGGSIAAGQFIAPLWEFFSFLQKQGKVVDGRTKGVGCYNFVVELSAKKVGKFYLLNVTDYQPIEAAEERGKFKDMALKAKESYDAQAARLSKEAYEKVRAEQKQNSGEASGVSSGPNANVAQSITKPATPGATVKPEPKDPMTVPFKVDNEPTKPLSFDDDDVSFDD